MASYQLKIKIKSLAAEARIIRHAETRAKDRKAHGRKCGIERMEKCHWERQLDLHSHRIKVVRPAAREALIAYGYLRGRPFASIEQKQRLDRTPPNWKGVIDNINRFGADVTTAKQLGEWACCSESLSSHSVWGLKLLCAREEANKIPEGKIRVAASG